MMTTTLSNFWGFIRGKCLGETGGGFGLFVFVDVGFSFKGKI